jgi:hypothetical protein
MSYTKRKPTESLSVSRTVRCQLMMKSLPDDLWLEPWPKIWQKFDTEGIVHNEFVPPGQTVNGKLYCDVLKRLRGNIQRKCPGKWCNNSWALNRNNALTHASLVQQFLASTKTTVIPHPPYLPDIAPCDFFLFPKMKFKLLNGWQFDSTEEIQTKSQNVMKTLTRNNFQQCFQSWKSRWDHCINAKGDYFEEDGGKYKFW